MACFTVPLATAVVASAAKTALPASAQKNPFVAKLGWLGKMMFGGSFLLAIEHVYHGEIIFTPPFLTAAKEGPEAMSEMYDADNKELMILPGFVHTDLYDGGGKDAIPFDRLESFFRTYLV